jgi:hypothetical protein
VEKRKEKSLESARERIFARAREDENPKGIALMEPNFPASHIPHNVLKPEKPGEEREFNFRQLKRFLVIFRNS